MKLTDRLPRPVGAARLLMALLAFVGLQLPAASAAAAAAAPTPVDARQAAQPRPAIWLLADGDTRIYLFGTVHILPAALQWRSPAIDRIIAEADELVTELGDESDLPEPAAVLNGMRMRKAVPIMQRVSADRRQPLRELIGRSGLPTALFDNLETWGAAFLLMSFQAANVYAETDENGEMRMPELSGVEDVLLAEFRARGRPISGVEQVAEQMAVFSNLNRADQRALLEMTIDEFAGGPVTDDRMDEDWRTGNVEAIAAAFEDMPAYLRDPMLARRNANWTEWLARRLERPGTVLFAVGAGHLAGEDSVQNLLRQRGLTVTRLQ